MYPVFLSEKARHRISPIELRSISLPLIRKINSLERRNLVPEEETRHARTHARARTAAARKKGREAKRALVALGGAGERAPRFCTAFTRLTDSGRCNDREASFQGIVAPRGVSILFLLEWLARMSCSRPPRRRVGQRSSFSNSTRLPPPFYSLSLSRFFRIEPSHGEDLEESVNVPARPCQSGGDRESIILYRDVERLVRFRGNRIVDIFNAVRERSRLCEIRKRDFGE